jgi:hypothetical protein
VRLNETARWLFRLCVILVASLAVSLAGDLEARAANYPSARAIEDAFQEGLRALDSGDSGTAIRLFRSILAQEPALPRVRLELARAYFRAKEWERSRREFFAVLSGDVPDAVRTTIIKFLRAIDARRGFDWNLSVSLTASPQATRDYDSDIVLVDFFGVPLPFEIERDNSGQYGIAVRGSAEYRREIPGPSRDGVRVTGVGEAFFDVFEGNGSSADDYLVGGGLGARGIWPQTTVNGSANLSTRYFGGKHFEDRVELRSGLEWRSRSGLALFSSMAVGLVDDHLSDFRDGGIGRMRVGLARSLGGRAIVGLALFGEHLDADARFESYLTLGGEVFGSTDLGYGLDANARLYFLDQDYEARIPSLFDAREEQEYGIDVAFTKTDFFVFGQFSPFVKVGYSRRNSTIDAFSYNEYRVDIGLEKAF